MDAAVMARIFEPFFTTKPVGEGTGLGLAVAQGVARAHEGTIAVRSEPGRGTTFELTLPAAAEATKVGAGATLLPRGQSQRILVVDDEPMVAKSLHLTLEQIGYRVISTLHPDQALGFIRTAPDRFDAVITDFQMPGMTGLELMAQIRQVRPQIPVIITSGFAGRMTPERLREAGASEFLPKPMEAGTLAEALARILGGAGAGPGVGS